MKISVAIACYNGAKYIKEQLDSILAQSVPVDEIIVSDDGSNDGTVDIVLSFSDPRIRFLTDNPCSGYCGNFDYALKHTTGDIVFVCDQDDLWANTKVEKHIEIFNAHPDIELIVTNGSLIDQNGNRIDNDSYNLNTVFTPHLSKCATGKLSQREFLPLSVYQTLANGMRMCVRRTLLDRILPFPQTSIQYDRWIGFYGLKNDAAYYLQEDLVQYRLHESNTSMRGNASIKKRWKRLLSCCYNTPFDLYNMSCAMLNAMTDESIYAQAIQAAMLLKEQSWKQIKALECNRFQGGLSLIKLYCPKKSPYRTNGGKYFIGQLYLVYLGRRYMRKHHRAVECCGKHSDP